MSDKPDNLSSLKASLRPDDLEGHVLVHVMTLVSKIRALSKLASDQKEQGNSEIASQIEEAINPVIDSLDHLLEAYQKSRKKHV